MVAVHPYRPGFDTPGQAMGEAEILCPHAGRETVDGVVGLRGDFVGILVAVGDQHGAKDFFPVQGRSRTAVLEDGRLNEVTLVAVPAAARENFPAFAAPLLNVTKHALVLFLADQRAHLRFRAAAAAEFHGAGNLHHAAHHVVKDGFFDEQARACHANLAVVEEDGIGCAGDSLVEVRVFGDDHGTLAAQFQRHAFQTVDRNLADLSSVEQTVIRQRFNWQEQQESSLTLEEVGKIIGVTKERVRQIQNKALAKIRAVMEDGVLRVTPRTAEEAAAEAQQL